MKHGCVSSTVHGGGKRRAAPPLGAVPARAFGGGATLSSRAAEGAFGHHMAGLAPLPPPAEHRSGCRTAIAFPCCRLAHGAGRNHMPRLGRPIAIASTTEQVFSMSRPPCAAKTLLYRAAKFLGNRSLSSARQEPGPRAHSAGRGFSLRRARAPTHQLCLGGRGWAAGFG
jgi:hypothetical protein